MKSIDSRRNSRLEEYVHVYFTDKKNYNITVRMDFFVCENYNT